MHELRIQTERRSHVLDITRDVREAMAGERGSAVVVYVPHTTAGVTVNENADPAVARDLEAALERMVDDGWPWEHVEPGEENAPTHVRAALMGLAWSCRSVTTARSGSGRGRGSSSASSTARAIAPSTSRFCSSP